MSLRCSAVRWKCCVGATRKMEYSRGMCLRERATSESLACDRRGRRRGDVGSRAGSVKERLGETTGHSASIAADDRAGWAGSVMKRITRKRRRFYVNKYYSGWYEAQSRALSDSHRMLVQLTPTAST